MDSLTIALYVLDTMSTCFLSPVDFTLGLPSAL